ncbi:MAG: ABC transporter permease [Corynebacterium sp.]|uniref:ABC transporter permease n=1 Tax=unclassified Corynebacterium TaxID=2624378 RepID=UPI0009FA3B82|nr:MULTISPECIES: ABC transporter permease [unclassified Corynebacterium]
MTDTASAHTVKNTAAEKRKPRQRRRSSSHSKVQSISLALIIPVIIAVVWEVAGRAGWIADGLFPPLSVCVAAFVDWVSGIGLFTSDFTPSEAYSTTWLAHVGASVGRVLMGFVLGSVLAIVFGILAGISWHAKRMIDPTINAIRPISVTGWVPIALIIFGIGDQPAVFLTALATFFPVYVNTLSGVQRVDRGLIRAGRMLGAPQYKVVMSIVLPAASPNIITGLRVSLGIAWTTVVVAEILGAKSGVGYVLIDSYNQFRFDYVIAAMATLGICGIVTDKLLQWIFADALRWSDN